MIDTESAAQHGRVKRAAVASLVGSALEWYDFFLYGTAAALVFNELFFPTVDPVVGTIAAFGTNAVGFLARPLGGIVFGHFGDRYGRRPILVITLLTMGIATFLIGALPTYATVGALAPILLILLRVVQGIAVGGEWGGGVLIVSEQAPQHKRGFFSAWSQTGVGFGFALAAGVFSLVQAFTDDAQFLAWGWRIPFLLGVVITAIGLVIRLAVAESPVMAKHRDEAPKRPPVIQVLREEPKSVLTAFGARIAENGATYIFVTFSLAYAKKTGIDTSAVLAAVMVGMVLESFAMLAWGALSDRIGRRPVYLFGAIAMVVWAFPFFPLMHHGTLGVMAAVIPAVIICHGPMIGTQPAYFTELFDERTRYTGVALGHEIASTVAGGFSPMIATALFAWAGGFWPVSVFMIVMAAVTIVTIVLSPETNPRRPVTTPPQPAATS